MTIGPFRDEYRWLSNFWDAPIVYKGTTYKTNEHFYQSHKTKDFVEVDAILRTQTPGQAKRLGNTITIRDDWDAMKYTVLAQATYLKYVQHKNLQNFLLATKDEDIVEYNTWHDNFWGVCTCNDCNGTIGENNFGKILMDVRYTLSQHPPKGER